MNNLEARKRALAAESEMYRQLLKLQIQNLRLNATGMKRRYALSSPLMRLLPIAASILGSPVGRMLLSKRRSRWLRLAATALIGWQTYRRLAPLLHGFFPRRTPPAQSMPDSTEGAATEAAS